METNNKMAILVLSCDKYSAAWDNFFDIMEKFWPDRNFPCYLATDSKEYHREGVEVIHFGNIRQWSKCARIALEQIESPYISLFLEDAFIYKKIDNNIINEDLDFVEKNHVDFLTLETKRAFIPEEQWEYVAYNIVKIPPHHRYGVETSAAIWDKNYFIKKLSEADCSAWEFEVNRCKEAQSEKGHDGIILYDARGPYNISPIEVIRVGKWWPGAIKYFHELGYDINPGNIPIMNIWEVLGDKIRRKVSGIKFARKPIKKVAKLMGFPVYSDD